VFIEIINTGSELMLGRVLNTHQHWLCRQLADLGRVVARQVAVADTAADIEQAVREALARADLVITTGGLGPTSDDITRDRIAALLGRKLHEDAAIVAHIEGFFRHRHRVMPASTRVQAMIPEGATILHNANGTAPGLAMRVAPNPFREGGKTSWLMMLPGPPRELRPMFTESVAPLIAREFPLESEFTCRTLKTTGIGESVAEEKIAGPLKPLTDSGLELGYCARSGEVDLRFVAHGAKGAAMVADAERIVRGLLGEAVYGEGDDQLESVLVRLLTQRGETLAIAESCTGGFVANRTTNVPGASAVLLAGLVTYSNAAKQEFLGVRAETLAAHGAVSEATAREMAEGARRRTGATYGIATTGIAGPTGETPGKPVGTVFMAVASARGTTALHRINRYDRETFKFITSQQVLDLLRLEVLRGA
jgi:nicotinamide-nucleotide amidase